MEGESYPAQLRELDRDVAVLKTQHDDAAKDIDRLGDKIREEVGTIRAETRQALRDMTEESRRTLAAMEERTSAAVSSVEVRGNERWNRARNWAITALIIVVPIVSALVGALVRGVAH